MTKSEIFKTAHAQARKTASLVGDYRIALSIALKEAHKMNNIENKNRELADYAKSLIENYKEEVCQVIDLALTETKESESSLSTLIQKNAPSFRKKAINPLDVFGTETEDDDWEEEETEEKKIRSECFRVAIKLNRTSGACTFVPEY